MKKMCSDFLLNSPLLSKLGTETPDEGNFSSYLESLLTNLKFCYPELIFHVEIFNPRKKNSKVYAINDQYLEFKVKDSLEHYDNDISNLFPYEETLSQNKKVYYPLIKEKSHIGFLVFTGSSKSKSTHFDMILAAQFIVRAMISNEKKLAIDSLEELNLQLEKIVEEKTQSLLREKEVVFQSSKMATLGEIASGVAHEINNPLTIIQAKAIIMQKKMEKKQILDTDMAEGFQKIISTVARITKIIKGLRFISRDGSSDSPVRVMLSQVLEMTLDLCVERLRNNQIKFEVDTFVDDFEIEVKETQMVQVFLNLINNSFDAIKELENKWVKISIEGNDNLVTIRFTDSGLGISESILEKIMNPFFTTKPIGQGTGLGLSSSKGIVEGHSGKLYYNKKSPNTQFVIEIPYIRKVQIQQKAA
ncbi:MAG: GHKL domain-containing protein [Deltaproteobacteria bacterium]|nr:GHKL domain-containing protein [Deltaproteobacteria bacterium]